MKGVLRYAETTVGNDEVKWALLGWGGKAADTALEAPGQARTLEAPRQGEGCGFLDWKEPVDGAAVASYKIEHRERPAGTGGGPTGPFALAADAQAWRRVEEAKGSLFRG